MNLRNRSGLLLAACSRVGLPPCSAQHTKGLLQIGDSSSGRVTSHVASRLVSCCDRAFAEATTTMVTATNQSCEWQSHRVKTCCQVKRTHLWQRPPPQLQGHAVSTSSRSLTLLLRGTRLHGREEACRYELSVWRPAPHAQAGANSGHVSKRTLLRMHHLCTGLQPQW